MLAGAALVFLATTAAAFGGAVPSRRLAQGDPRLEQLQAGWEVYRLWCSACHAYSGEGLTPAWISTWAPDDQNCWQSKCHHELTHPDDGFFLPHFIPAIVGQGVLDHFGDGPTLYGYVSTLMPYQEPGVLSQDQYYAVLAQVLNMNGIDYGREPLGPATIGAVALGSSPAPALPAAPTVEAPEVHSMPPAAAAATSPTGPRPAAWLAGLLISLGLAAMASVAVAVEVRSSRE